MFGPSAFVRLLARTGIVTAVLLLVGTGMHQLSSRASANAPAGFEEVTAFSGLVEPTVFRFSPDGRVFVGEKSGLIKVFSNLNDTAPDIFADLRTQVHNFWDRGLLGLALPPNFPTDPSVYVGYTYDAAIGGTAPRWGTAGATSDTCPNPPGATTSGCVVSSRIDRLTATGNTMTKRTTLVEDWCQQYPSHTIGSLQFGADGYLYVSGGDGASFTFTDYGQNGSPINPCGDPPGSPGTVLTPPTAEGGTLRSQDPGTTGDPFGLDGTIIRIDPATGAGAPGNPFASSEDPNARRIVAYGMRNPFRTAVRPGTNELWIGDVGASKFEEINRLVNPNSGQALNFGWPCYEGPEIYQPIDDANLNICESLYAKSSMSRPFYSYSHTETVGGARTCSGSSTTTGLAFAPTVGGSYPNVYNGALFFADYARKCIWAMKTGANGVPDPTKIEGFVTPAANPVFLEFGPRGELYYADLQGGRIQKIVNAASPPPPPGTCADGTFAAQYFNNVNLAGTPALTRCENTIDNNWGFTSPSNGVNNDNFSARWTGRDNFAAGTYEFTATGDDGIRIYVDDVAVVDGWKDQPATTYTGRRTLSAGLHNVRVEFYDRTRDAVASVDWAPIAAPTPEINTPSGTYTWAVGNTVNFSGSATDPQEGTLPASALTWTLVIQHCPSTCHSHPIQSFSGIASGSFAAPDHDYPSYLELRLTATDAQGNTATVTRSLQPKTVNLGFQTNPTGLRLGVGLTSGMAPFTRTVIVGSTISLSAPGPQTLNGAAYIFARWSDAGTQNHNTVASSTPTTYTAIFNRTG